MVFYIILVSGLAIVFGFALIVVLVLSLKLKKENEKQMIVREESFTPHEKLNIFSTEFQDANDDVFDEDESLAQTVSFALYHNKEENVLLLDVWLVLNTPPEFTQGFIEAQIFPSDFETGQFITKVRECIDNCVVYNESFCFTGITHEMLSQIYLKLFLYKMECDILPRCVGHDVFALKEVQWKRFGKTQLKRQLQHHEKCDASFSPQIYTIMEESPSSSPSRAHKGELYISLRYQKSCGRISVVVMKAENIPRGNILQNDTFVKVKLLYDGNVLEKKQTRTQKRTNASPCWNEPFVFNIDEDKGLNNYELVFLLRRRDLFTPQSTIGIVRIGAQVGGAGQSHWYAMLAKGNLMTQVARRHKIK